MTCRSDLQDMSAEAPWRAPEGFCDLPAVEGLPDLCADQLRAHGGGPDAVRAAKGLLAKMRQQGLEEGDEAELELSSLEALLRKDNFTSGILAALDPDTAFLCELR